ncbi:MAG: hypothetical protein U0935_02460 [Pirellulales bacterium]
MFPFTNPRAQFPEIWSRVMRDDPPNPQGALGELMKLLEEVFNCEQIDHVVVKNSASFLFDLRALGFSGLGWNVLIVSPPPRNDDEARWQAEFLAEQKQAADSIGFCFQLYLSDTLPAKNRFVASSQEAVFLCRADLERIFTASIPKMALAAIIRSQTPLSRLCPFNTSQEASGAMFYGRRAELSLLVEDLSKSVAIQGARRLGKTSLLRHAYRTLRNRFANDRWPRVFYFNCLTWSSYAFACFSLAHQIDPKREQRLAMADKNVEYMLERASRGGSRPLYLFFDEVDRLIDLDAMNNWRFFSLLAWAKAAGLIRFVVAGYRSVSRLVFGQEATRSLDTRPGHEGVPPVDTPLLLALEPLHLSPLDRKDADKLLAEPLEITEVKIHQEPQVQERVWRATIGHPFLIQFIGQHLYRIAVERNPHYITPDDVEAVEQSADLREFLETHFIESTLHNGIPVPQERACAFLFAHSLAPHWSEQDFWESCTSHGVDLGRDPLGAIHRAVKNLIDAQVLTRIHGRLSFAFPMMRQVLVNAFPDVTKGIRALAGG